MTITHDHDERWHNSGLPSEEQSRKNWEKFNDKMELALILGEPWDEVMTKKKDNGKTVED